MRKPPKSDDLWLTVRVDPALLRDLEAAMADAGPEWNKARAVRTAVRLALSVGLPEAERQAGAVTAK